jgi:HD-GYP domain-containing protein (c-di-GMP phosphodiesterase class II)
MRTGRSYSVHNQLFGQQLESLLEPTALLLRTEGQFLFVAHEGELFLNGARIATTTHGFRMSKTLVADWEQRGIVGLEVRGEPTVEAWRGFFELLFDTTIEPGAPLVRAAQERGLTAIVPVLRVLDEAGEAEGVEPGLGANDLEPQKTRTADDDTTTSRETRGGALGGRLSPQALEALGAAPKLYAAALNGLQSLLTSTTTSQSLEFRHVRRVVQPIVDASTGREPIFLGLAGLIRRDEYTYARNVNACLIATSIGQRIGMERGTLSHLAVAGLLHGIGRSVTTDPEKIGPAGAVLLAQRTSLQELTVRVMRVALEAGAGRASAGRSGALSQIVSISAVYARLVSARGELGRAITPAQALGMIVGPLTAGFDPALKSAMVETLGFHPPGQHVQLDDGGVALVVAPNREDLARPVVQPLRGPGGVPFDPVAHWPGGILPPERSITRDLMVESLVTELPEAA